ncbi:MAG: imidazole glycerol phosphate synthase subunit HisH [Gammaproteobacteria bacterium]|nr:imidazole glycerol phosphate synthase subunit HisH [Gammaproteobacteria bacterium]
MLIAIVDCGIGNLYSVKQAVSHAVRGNPQIVITDDAAIIRDADKVVFPGQGAAKDCMAGLIQKGLVEPLKTAATEKPFLGICLGLQVLFNYSEENDGTDCLGLIQGQVRHLSTAITEKNGYKIPHMGWNSVKQTVQHPLWDRIADNEYFYFVHSYYTDPDNEQGRAGCAHYGTTFSCAVTSGYIFAVQFHPEKSADCGLRLLQNFGNWNGAV